MTQMIQTMQLLLQNNYVIFSMDFFILLFLVSE